MLTSIKQRFNNWLFRPKIEHGTVVLTQRRIFILPTRQGMALCLVLILMMLGDINYNLSLGYVLTFLLAMMAVMSMLHAFRNLAHLEIRAGRCNSVYAGEKARFIYHFDSRLPRYQLCLRSDNSEAAGHRTAPSSQGMTTDISAATVQFDVPENASTEIVFPLPATRRGYLQTGRLTLYTEFPLGLFHAWSYLHFGTRCLVYPKPLSSAPLPVGSDGIGKRTVAGDDDFAGLRNYSPGDALPRIAWKAYARGHALQVKQFSALTGEALWLNFSDAPDSGIEDKLSRMTRWVLDAESSGLRYGLRLPDGELPAGFGTTHRDECLRRLALFNLPQESASLSTASPATGRVTHFATLSRLWKRGSRKET